MAVWESLREDLVDLLDRAPDAVVGYPSLDRPRPAGERLYVYLAAWASNVAATLHDKYGDQVDLQVGAMRFPHRGVHADPQGLPLHGAPAETIGLVVEQQDP